MSMTQAYRSPRSVPRASRNQSVMVGAALTMIGGTDERGNRVSQWMSSSELPVDLMGEIKKYLAQYPDLLRLEISIDIHDKEMGRPITIVDCSLVYTE